MKSYAEQKAPKSAKNGFLDAFDTLRNQAGQVLKSSTLARLWKSHWASGNCIHQEELEGAGNQFIAVEGLVFKKIILPVQGIVSFIHDVLLCGQKKAIAATARVRNGLHGPWADTVGMSVSLWSLSTRVCLQFILFFLEHMLRYFIWNGISSCKVKKD